jgi:hypothetical protein
MVYHWSVKEITAQEDHPMDETTGLPVDNDAKYWDGCYCGLCSCPACSEVA